MSRKSLKHGKRNSIIQMSGPKIAMVYNTTWCVHQNSLKRYHMISSMTESYDPHVNAMTERINKQNTQAGVFA